MTKCAECGGSDFLNERRWGYGRKRYWWCDMCFKRVEPSTDLHDHPDLAELGVVIKGFYGDPWATSARPSKAALEDDGHGVSDLRVS